MTHSQHGRIVRGRLESLSGCVCVSGRSVWLNDFQSKIFGFYQLSSRFMGGWILGFQISAVWDFEISVGARSADGGVRGVSGVSGVRVLQSGERHFGENVGGGF